MTQGIHLAMAWLAAVAAVAVISFVVLGRLAAQVDRRSIDRSILVAEVLVSAASVVGLALLIVGRRPADGLHLLFAAIALVVAPVARFWGGLRAAPRAGLLISGGVVLLVVLVRLGQTG
jgi:hypothetical protein